MRELNKGVVAMTTSVVTIETSFVTARMGLGYRRFKVIFKLHALKIWVDQKADLEVTKITINFKSAI